MTAQMLPDASVDGRGKARQLRAKPDASTGPAASAGWYLERERVRLGESVGTAARASGLEATRIRAIELGELKVFATQDEVLEALSAYADHLGFQPRPLVDHYCGFVDDYLGHGLPAGEQLVVDRLPGHEAGRSGRRRGMAGILAAVRRRLRGVVDGAVARLDMVRRHIAVRRPVAATWRAGAAVAGVVLVTGAVGWVMWPDSSSTGPPPRQAGAPRAAAPVPAGGERAVKQATRSGQAPVVVPNVRIRERALTNDVVSNDEPIAREEADKLTALILRQATGETASVRQPAANDPEPDLPRGKVYGDTAGKVRLVLRAIEGVWLRVETTDGKILFSRTLSAGDRYRVPARAGLVLAARNAGALQYIIDGKVRGHIGAPGDIVVGFPLDVGKLARSPR